MKLKRPAFTKRNIIIGVLGLVLVIAVGFQITRLQGNVKKVNTAATKQRAAVPATLKNNEKSVACDTVTAKEVSAVLKTDVERRAGFLVDRTTPYLFSACSYATKVEKGQLSRNVTITMRELANADAAHKAMESLRKAGKGEEVKGVGDEAYYVAASNQMLVRKGKRLVLVIVNKPQKGQPDSKTVSVSVAKLAL
jgi:hypothetical protein